MITVDTTITGPINHIWSPWTLQLLDQSTTYDHRGHYNYWTNLHIYFNTARGK